MFLSVPTLKCMLFMIITNLNHDLNASQEPFHGNLVENMLKKDETLNVTDLLYWIVTAKADGHSE